MTNDFYAPFIQKIFKHNNKDIHFEKRNINAMIKENNYPTQDTDKVGTTISMRFRDHNRLDLNSFRHLAPNERPEDDTTAIGYNEGPEDYDTGDVNDIYTSDFIILRFDTEEPYKMIAVSTDYKVIVVGSSNLDDHIFEYPLQNLEMITLFIRPEFVDPDHKPFGEVYRERSLVGAILRSDKSEPNQDIIMEYTDNECTIARFLTGDECYIPLEDYTIATDRYDEDYRTDTPDYSNKNTNDWYELTKVYKTHDEVVELRKEILEDIIPYTGE